MGRSISLRSLAGFAFFLFATQTFARFDVNCDSALTRVEFVNDSVNHHLETVNPDLKSRPVTVMSYNVANLFASEIDRSDEFSEDNRGGKKNKKKRNRRSGGREVKPAWKVAAITRIIASQSPDIVVLQEVENLNALELLNQDALHGEYTPYLIQGNDSRGINIGFLIRKGLNIQVEHITHRDTPSDSAKTDEGGKIFSRDLPAVIIRENGKSDPLFIVFGHHGKSKRDRNGDPESNKLRKAQLEVAAKIIKSFERRYPKAGIIMTGDFNTETQTADEMEPIHEFMKSAFDLTPVQIPAKDRVTHAFFPMGGSPKYSQLDDFFVTSPLWQTVEHADILRYTDKNGNPRQLPASYDERENQPSDHYAIVMKFRIKSK